jgi:hypothetical protein
MTRAIFMGATCSHACPSAAAGFSFLFPREDGLGPVGRHVSWYGGFGLGPARQDKTRQDKQNQGKVQG